MEVDNDCEVVFCGNMQYGPNIDASRYLVNEIMPLVWVSHPTARVVLAGATPSASVRSLACDRVRVNGSVRDIRPCYAASRIFVAPMRIGSGLQNKLLEAMAMGIPCVTTPVANNALDATVGKDVLVGNDANELAQCIVRLLDDDALRDRMSSEALTFVREKYSWHSMCKRLESVLANAVTKYSNK